MTIQELRALEAKAKATDNRVSPEWMGYNWMAERVFSSLLDIAEAAERGHWCDSRRFCGSEADALAGGPCKLCAAIAKLKEAKP